MADNLSFIPDEEASDAEFSSSRLREPAQRERIDRFDSAHQGSVVDIPDERPRMDSALQQPIFDQALRGDPRTDLIKPETTQGPRMDPVLQQPTMDPSPQQTRTDSAQIQIARAAAPPQFTWREFGPMQPLVDSLNGGGGVRKRKGQTGPAEDLPILPKSPSLRREKVTVYVRVVFLKLGEIDTVKECFTAEAFIQAKWREPLLDYKAHDTTRTEVDWNEYWNPKLYIDNTVGEPKETLWKTVVFNLKDEAFVCERRKVKGVFVENMELYEFPFDTQDITLTLISERSADELELAEDSSEISSVNVQSFVDEQEWRLYNKVETIKTIVNKVFEGSNERHPSLGSRCNVSRRIGFYVWNIYFIKCIITTMAFTTFSVSYTLSQNRLQLTFILLLTAVTFKFAVAQSLPRISYLTYLDAYVLSSMGVNVVLCIWHAVVAALIPKSNYTTALITQIDQYFLMALGSLYILAHVFFILYVYFKVLRKRRVHFKREREHKEKIDNQLNLSRAFLNNPRERSLD